MGDLLDYGTKLKYEYKCNKCKRPADFDVYKDDKGHTVKKPIEKCGNRRCKGYIELTFE